MSFYRFSDVGLMLGALAWHYYDHSLLIGPIFSQHIVEPHADPGTVAFMGICILLAIAGKSAQFPFSFWLPRAMEGPTPSSAAFYGAISIHAGAILALRVQPYLVHTPVWNLGLLGMGLLTAIYAVACGRVRSDVKTQIAYASLAQLSFVFVELALGFPTLAYCHMVGNMAYRATQILASPSVLLMARNLDLYSRANGALASTEWRHSRLVLYRAALFGFYLREATHFIFVRPLLRLSAWCNCFEDVLGVLTFTRNEELVCIPKPPSPWSTLSASSYTASAAKNVPQKSESSLLSASATPLPLSVPTASEPSSVGPQA